MARTQEETLCTATGRAWAADPDLDVGRPDELRCHEGYLGVSAWGRWGSCGDPGRGRVQICHKGAPGRDRPRRKARNINVSSRALRLDRGLCGRFGQTAAAGRVGRAVVRLGGVHGVGVGAGTGEAGGHGPGGRPVRPRRPRPSAARPARRRPGPRERGLTIENEGLTPVLMDQPPSSWAGAAGPRDHHDRPRGPTHPHPMIHITQHTQTPPE